MQAIPQTNANDIVEKLNGIQERGDYLDKNSFPWRSLKRDAENLIKIDAVSGWVALGMINSAAGDMDEAERCFERSDKLNPSITLQKNRAVSYLNLGEFTKASRIFSNVGSPETGDFFTSCAFGLQCGLFQTLRGFLDMAEKMNINMEMIPADIIRNSANILSRFNIDDASVSKHLDAVGAVFRQRKKINFYQPQVIPIDIDEVMTGVTMIFRVNCDPSEIFDYNLDLAQKEEEMNIQKHPAFDVVFALRTEEEE